MSTPNNPNPGQNNPNQWNTQPTPPAAGQPVPPAAGQPVPPAPGQPTPPAPGQPGAPTPPAPGQPGAPTPPVPPKAAKAPNAKNIAWTVWFYVGGFLLTLITSFLALKRAKEDFGYGTISFKMNWWGATSVSSSGFGRIGEAAIADEVENGGAIYVITSIVVLALFAVAAYFAWKASERQAAISGLAASAIQLLAVLVALIDILDTDGIHTGAAWWLWLLIGLATLYVSLQMFKSGRTGVEAKFNGIRAGAANRKQGNQA